MSGTRNVAVAIGVANADKLRYLGAAVNGAKAFYGWAQELGYEAKLLTDEEAPVSMQLLRETLDQLLKPSGTIIPIHRCVLYFAGHGLIREADEGLWLLSDWYSQLRAVAVEVLRRRLYLYNISQIAIFSDACRSLPTDIQASDLVADGVLGRGPYPPSPMVAIDKFIAAQDGNLTYSIPGQNPEDDRCIFTGVLLEGLWGVAPAAFSKLLNRKVTSSSLGTYLKTEVPKVAAMYQLTLNPTVLPTFPDDDNVYYGEDPLPPTSPSFPAWPDPGSLIARPDTHSLTGAHGSDPIAERDLFESLRQNLDRLLETPARDSRPASKMFADSDAFARELKNQTTDWFVPESGIEVKGAQVVALWAEPSVTVTLVAGRWMLQENGASLQRPVPILLELDEGGREALFVAITALPQFGAFLICNKQGASALRYESWEKDAVAPEVTEKALEAMESGTLRGDQAKMLALSIRRAKHAAPVLGAIAAYLYDSAGDLESIQRMAQFYIDMTQPIPYDVALMGQLDGEWRGPQLWAKVPPIAARTEPDPGAPWDSYAIAGGWGVVGGMWPWMKQGWAFLDEPEDIGTQLIRSVLLDVREHLTRARFTTGDKAGAMLLANAFGLQRKEERAMQMMHAGA